MELPSWVDEKEELPDNRRKKRSLSLAERLGSGSARGRGGGSSSGGGERGRGGGSSRGRGGERGRGRAPAMPRDRRPPGPQEGGGSKHGAVYAFGDPEAADGDEEGESDPEPAPARRTAESDDSGEESDSDAPEPPPPKRAAAAGEGKKARQGAAGEGKAPVRRTLTLAVPGTCLEGYEGLEMRTLAAYHIARAACLFRADEVVVFTEDGSEPGQAAQAAAAPPQGRPRPQGRAAAAGQEAPELFLGRVLQYVETPPHLRAALLEDHPDLRCCASLPPLDAPHHARPEEAARFREAVALPRGKGAAPGALVDAGLRAPVAVERAVPARARVTLDFGEGPAARSGRGPARVVPPAAPLQEAGLYWGFSTRLAAGLSGVLADGPHQYDFTLGVAAGGGARGPAARRPVPAAGAPFELPRKIKVPASARHVLVVVAGAGGLEACVRGDARLPSVSPKGAFARVLDPCPAPGARGLHSDEALLAALALLQRPLRRGEALRPPAPSP